MPTIAASAGALFFFAVACTVPAAKPTAQAVEAPRGAAAARDAHEQLNSVLWMQTAGEYWALASSTYESARRAIDSGLRNRSWTAATEQQGNFGRLPPAVILDLDETVLDNMRFQDQLVLDRSGYDGAVWGKWVASRNASLVPGAADFVHYAESRKVNVFFVTNRTDKEETDTVENLKALGINATPDSVLCNSENGWTSDKSPRRLFLSAKYRILALVGDDMNDFVSVTGQSPEQRVETAKKYAKNWGARWFLIPNPTYGSWERSLYPGITADAEVLAKKRSLLRGL